MRPRRGSRTALPVRCRIGPVRGVARRIPSRGSLRSSTAPSRCRYDSAHQTRAAEVKALEAVRGASPSSSSGCSGHCPSLSRRASMSRTMAPIAARTRTASHGVVPSASWRSVSKSIGRRLVNPRMAWWRAYCSGPPACPCRRTPARSAARGHGFARAVVFPRRRNSDGRHSREVARPKIVGRSSRAARVLGPWSLVLGSWPSSRRTGRAASDRRDAKL